jgi:methylated-DNA-[protein]-cysteine S-methyltransferase
MTDRGFMLFDTQIGPCGIAWSDRGVIAVQLPEGDEAKTRARLLRRCPHAREAAPPAAVQDAIEGIISLLRGERHDLSAIALDMDGLPSFDRRVYEVARTIAPGATLSYGEISARLGARDLAREVGQALGRNPFPIIVPCHRVLAAGGKAGGFSANGGITTKPAPAHDRTRAHERYAYVIRWRQHVRLCNAAPAPQLALSAVAEPGLPASA